MAAKKIHRHRHIRLKTSRERNIARRVENFPRKTKERARRDARIVATIKATPKGKSYSPAVQSWIAAQLDKAWRQVTDKDIAQVIA